MIKSRTLLIGIILTLTLALITPTAAYAKSDTGHSMPVISSFSDSVFVMVTSPGTSNTRGNRIITRGEIIEGSFGEVSDFPVISGAVFKATHYSEITLFSPDTTTGIGTFSGSSINELEIDLVPEGKLRGVSPTRLSGHYLINTFGLAILDAIDQGKFSFGGQIKIQNSFSFVQSSGSLSALLTPVQIPGTTQFTLGGDATFSGTTRTISR
jgi:hypothetical protein